MKALIDGDIIVYSVGFTVEKTNYSVDGVDFDKKAEAKEYCEQMGIVPENISSYVIPEDVTHAYHNAKQLINNICTKTGATEYEIFLTGKDNFREDIATIQPYKGNRDTSHKPVHYDAIKEYLIKHHGAEVVNGIEADDKLGHEQTHDTCICTIDKDLDMIVGWHYNWRKDIMYKVNEWDAIKFFYTQLLTGDTVDNIRGVPQIGKVKAAKLLDGATSEYTLYNRVRQAYLDYFHKEYGDSVPRFLSEQELLEMSDADLQENADLLWIQRKEDDRWIPPQPEGEDDEDYTDIQEWGEESFPM